MKPHIKCIVKNCENHTDEGRFVGELCGPCWEFITQGTGKFSQAYRNAWKMLFDHALKEM